MKKINIYFASIPNTIWHTWPNGRSLSNLSEDALGIERRIKKNIQPMQERERYSQLCNRIESIALELILNQKIDYLFFGASNNKYQGYYYLKLIESLNLCLSLEKFVNTTPKGLLSFFINLFFKKKVIFFNTQERQNFIIKSFYTPGEEVKTQQIIFENLTTWHIKTLLSIKNKKKLNFYSKLVSQKVAFLKKASLQKNAIVVILSMDI